MAPKIFLTGGTGYVGGTVLRNLVTTHPEYEIKVLLRREPPGFSAAYPGVTILKGTFDDSSILKKAASEADIIIHHGNSDHLPAVEALISGATARAEALLPAFYIHLGGTGIITDLENLGKSSDKVWSDIQDIDELWSLPLDRIHRATEAVIQSAWTHHGDRFKAAVVCPPNIHGPGRGPGNVASLYVPIFYHESIVEKSAFYVNEGSNVFPRTHVDNVAEVFLKLTESAVAGGQDADWNREGYYFVPSEDISQLEIAMATSKILYAKGLLDNEEPKRLSVDELDKKLTHMPVAHAARYLFASNTRFSAERAKKTLNVKSNAPGFFECLEGDLNQALEKENLV